MPDNSSIGINVNYGMLEQGVACPKPQPVIDTTAEVDGEQQPKRGRGRPRKNPDEATGMAPVQQNTVTQGNLFCTNTPYMSTFDQSIKQYDYIAGQAAVMASELKLQFDSIKNNKVMKNKFMHLNECASAINSLLSTEIQCVREKTKIQSDCHNFEMKRSQAQKAAEAAVPDNKYVADLYQAYINMPTAQQVPNNPLTMTAAVANNNPAYSYTPVMDDSADYANFHNNITPEQNRMILGDNPNIETVVCYNDATDEKYFMVIDNLTGQPVPNYPLPDEMMLQGADINKLTMTVSNSNFGEQWRLVPVNH